MTSRLSKDDLKELKLATPLDNVIGKHVKLGRANAKGVRAGMCLCTPKKGKTPLWVNPGAGTWGCLYGGCGGDVFTFLEQFEGLNFSAALTVLNGGRASASPEEMLRLERERAERESARVARAAELFQQERRRAYDFWQRGVPVEGTLVDAYFRHRGLDAVRSKALRFSADEPYWLPSPDDAGQAMLVHRGPCLLAAIQGPDGTFMGLHRTWLDPRLGSDDMPREASGKAILTAPDGTPLPAKKMRGGKQGGAIRLHRYLPDAVNKIFLAGEGIETVETVYQAVRDEACVTFIFCAWAAGDLANLSGGTQGLSTPHPEKPKCWVPSDDPDLALPGMMPPAGTTRAILLGDGDSDPYVTSARLRCAKTRWEAAGIPTTIVMAARGKDFNDLVRMRA